MGLVRTTYLPRGWDGGSDGKIKEGGICLKYTLTEKEIAAIEQALNKGGANEVTVKIEHSKVAVIEVAKKKIM